MLDRMRLRLVVIGAVVGILVGLTPTARSAAPTVEDRIIALINAERAERLSVHWGLLAAARNHSQNMAREGGLSHEGADERVNSAPPDPGEFNGAPDDGFAVAAWCENVTYTVINGRIFDAATMAELGNHPRPPAPLWWQIDAAARPEGALALPASGSSVFGAEALGPESSCQHPH